MIKKAFIGGIRFYQAGISPLLGSHCRYYPSCSHYAVEAFQKLPFWQAIGKSIWRILRCNPFARGGYDPVIKEEEQ
jgi:putative membrane protein insertion efficiency factor